MIGGDTGSILTSHCGVAGDTLDEGGVDVADTDTSTSKTDGSKACTVDLGGGKDGGRRGLDDDTSRLHGAANQASRGEGVAGAAEDEPVTAHGLACGRHDGAGDASWTGQ